MSGSGLQTSNNITQSAAQDASKNSNADLSSLKTPEQKYAHLKAGYDLAVKGELWGDQPPTFQKYAMRYERMLDSAAEAEKSLRANKGGKIDASLLRKVWTDLASLVGQQVVGFDAVSGKAGFLNSSPSGAWDIYQSSPETIERLNSTRVADISGSSGALGGMGMPFMAAVFIETSEALHQVLKGFVKKAGLKLSCSSAEFVDLLKHNEASHAVFGLLAHEGGHYLRFPGSLSAKMVSPRMELCEAGVKIESAQELNEILSDCCSVARNRFDLVRIASNIIGRQDENNSIDVPQGYRASEELFKHSALAWGKEVGRGDEVRAALVETDTKSGSVKLLKALGENGLTYIQQQYIHNGRGIVTYLESQSTVAAK